MPIKIISINQLKPHEQTCPDHLFRLQSKIAGDGIFTHPIVVDRTTKIILDGHHRHRVLERLGYTKIPCLVADYLSSQIKLTSRCQSDIKKETIIKHALRGRLLRPKTTKHYLRLSATEIIPLEKIKTKTKIPLSQLT